MEGQCLQRHRALKPSEIATNLTLQDLQQHFDKPLVEAAKYIGIGGTLLKKACRRIGLVRWPQRQIACLQSGIRSLELNLRSATGDRRHRILHQIHVMKQKIDRLYKGYSVDDDEYPRTRSSFEQQQGGHSYRSSISSSCSSASAEQGIRTASPRTMDLDLILNDSSEEQDDQMIGNSALAH